MTDAVLRRLIETHLADTPGIAAIAWENVAFTPEVNRPWWRVRLDAVQSVAGVGSNAPTQWRGTLRLSLFLPEGAGSNAGDTAITAVMDRFRIGTFLTDGTVIVTIGTTTRGRASAEPPWYVIPLEITWFSYKGA
jgi:hypothetical protein